MRKRLIALMLAGMMVVGTLTSCVTDKKEKNNKSIYDDDSEAAYHDKYITIEDADGNNIVHRGTYIGAFNYANNKYDFDCSEPFVSNKDSIVTDEMPADWMYDEVCDECCGD